MTERFGGPERLRGADKNWNGIQRIRLGNPAKGIHVSGTNTNRHIFCPFRELLVSGNPLPGSMSAPYV